IVAPYTKLATTRWWHTSTLAEELDVGDADADDLYRAMDWLLERQDGIERKLAARHLKSGGLALYDLTSSYFEAHCCPLAPRGPKRAGREGRLRSTGARGAARRGCRGAVWVFDGNTADSTTFLPQADKLRQQFGLRHVVLVGDRGMICTAAIEELRRQHFD